MRAATNRFKQARPCRPQRCETQRFLVPSIPAQAGMEPRHSAPSGGSVVLASSVATDAGEVTSVGAMFCRRAAPKAKCAPSGGSVVHEVTSVGAI